MWSSDLQINILEKEPVQIDIEPRVQENEDHQKPLHLFKLIQSLNSACDKNIKQLKKLLAKHPTLENVEPLKLLVNNTHTKVFSTAESKKQFKILVTSSFLTLCFEECQDDSKELLFFAAATFHLDRLKEIVKGCNLKDLNETRCSDSVITFTLKYGDISNENFFECMRTLIDAGVDINKGDACGRFAIYYVATLFNKTTELKVLEDLRRVGKLLLDRQICEPEETVIKNFIKDELNVDLSQYKYARMDTKTKLFFWISKYKKDEFMAFKKIQKFVNCDNGESTLLQFAVNKSENMLPVVEHLLKKGADPNRVTETNAAAPVEIAARNNYEAIFRLILNWKDTKISEEQFNIFVKARGHSIKRELFGIFIESAKIDPTFIYWKTGNTPLHYAIRLCHKNAIYKLLKRPEVSLTARNYAEKCPLDILNADELNLYLDSCLVFDTRRTLDFNSTEYKMQFRFARLNDGSDAEVEVVSLIGKYPQLEHLLGHPLVHTYIMLKWYRVKVYFWAILIFKFVVFTALSIFFYRFPHSSQGEHIVCFCLCVIEIVLKCWVFLTPKDVLKDLKLSSLKPINLHQVAEILLMISLIGSFFLTEFRAFVFVEMAVTFLLTAGYYPRLSHWSIMLQTVFRTFGRLLAFFSLLMIAFAAAFHIMFEDHRFFTALYRAIFMSYFMTIGEINVGEVDFEATPFGGYLLFFLFAMSMSVVIINFWTATAIRDMDKCEKRSEINALKNVVAFIAFIERNVYGIECLRKVLPNPLIFSPAGNDDYVVDFYVNKEDQFEYKFVPYDERVENDNVTKKRRFPHKLNQVCFNKIKAHFYKQQNITNEQKILIKLDQVLKLMNNIARDKSETSNNEVFKKKNTMA